ncbi:phosphoribosyltransferase [Dictyobacter aurantiacus]|uniref:Phosphoribosyl transferase n=1 Tax=Dictyobacter aurantiacus TaxID=1936993 RepID=A0A401ZGM4_9CHLR|nr:phosphoribosyltransferase [Dictyobacter aurantiacus]GCE06009.1 phosphoribosyl transferase [Dictyobacter aurantiacus]
MVMRFRDRRDAGKQLATQLAGYRNRPDVVVLGLPRGGVPVAFEVASELHAPLDVMIVRKLGLPGQEELAMGALAQGGIRILNDDVISAVGIPNEVIDAVAAREQQEIERREHLYRGDRPALDVRGRTVVLVDDGIATGATIRAAIAALKRQHPAHLIIAVPVAAATTCDELAAQGDKVICLLKPDMLYAIGLWYENFSQTHDEEVRQLLACARSMPTSGVQKQVR